MPRLFSSALSQDYVYSWCVFFLSPCAVRHNGALLLAASECVVWPLESRGGRGERGGGAHGPHPL